MLLDWWFQTILYVVTFACFMLLMEFFRWFPSINLPLSILATLLFFPIQIGIFPGFDAGTFGTTSKFVLIVPFLILLCFWRLAYMPYYPASNTTKSALHQLHYFTVKLSQKMFCTTNLSPKELVPSKGMEIVWFLLAAVNILVAVVPGFLGGSISNPIAGILLAFSFPIPGQLANKFHGIYMTNKYNQGAVYDGVADGLTFFWVLGFTSWDLLFVFTHSTKDFFLHSFHLVPNCVRCIVTRHYDLWAELRVYTFAVSLCMLAAMRTSAERVDSWFLSAANMPRVMQAARSKVLVEVWGSLNVVLAGIHVVLWVKELVRRRGVEAEDVQQQMIVDARNGDKQGKEEEEEEEQEVEKDEVKHIQV